MKLINLSKDVLLFSLTLIVLSDVALSDVALSDVALSDVALSDVALSDVALAQGSDVKEQTTTAVVNDSTPEEKSTAEAKQLDTLTTLHGIMSELDQDFANQNTSRAAQTKQQEIIAALKMLAQDQQQSQQNAASAASSAVQIRKPQPENDDTQGDSAKKNEQSVIGENTPATDQPVIDQKMQEAIWGHLPDRIRDRIRNVEGETFLPKYEKLIRAYYERLASELIDD